MGMKNVLAKVIGYESLYMFLVTLIACGAALVQTILKKFAGHYSSFIFGGDIYQYNYFMYILGIGIYFIAAFIIYRKLQKGLDRFAELNNILRIVTLIVLIIWGVIMFSAEFVVLFVSVLGLSNDLRPDYLFLFTVIGWPLVSVMFLAIQMIRKCYKS